MSTISMAPGNCSAATFQIHAAPSPMTTRRSAVSKPRRCASRWTVGRRRPAVGRCRGPSRPRRCSERPAVAHGPALCVASAVHTVASLTSGSWPNPAAPPRPSTSVRTGTPLPSSPRYIVGAGLGTVSPQRVRRRRPHVPGLRRSARPAWSTRTAASSHNRLLCGEAGVGGRQPHQPQHAGRQRRGVHTQGPVARTHPRTADVAMVVGPFQRQRPEQRDEGLRAAAGKARPSAAGASHGRIRRVGIVRVEVLRQRLRGEIEDSTTQGLLKGLACAAARRGPSSAATSAANAATNAAPKPSSRPARRGERSTVNSLQEGLEVLRIRVPPSEERLDVGLDRRLQRREQLLQAPFFVLPTQGIGRSALAQYPRYGTLTFMSCTPAPAAVRRAAG